MQTKTTVIISKFAEKQISKIPAYIKEHLWVWASSVEEIGIREVRKLGAYHDEPLQGMRLGQRSIRLTRAYRLIYVEEKNGVLEVILVKEVTKHVY